jgi:hypothetical protein
MFGNIRRPQAIALFDPLFLCLVFSSRSLGLGPNAADGALRRFTETSLGRAGIVQQGISSAALILQELSVNFRENRRASYSIIISSSNDAESINIPKLTWPFE